VVDVDELVVELEVKVAEDEVVGTEELEELDAVLTTVEELELITEEELLPTELEELLTTEELEELDAVLTTVEELEELITEDELLLTTEELDGVADELEEEPELEDELVALVEAAEDELELPATDELAELEANDDDEEEDKVELLDVDELAPGVSAYNWILLPAPQYEYLSPGQRKLQSAWLATNLLSGERVLPQ
jgi:hypothetical protein